jgi:hypothetical protein
MASGINNTFRQIGIATGIAALGAIFQSRIASHLAASGLPKSLAPAIASGASPGPGNNPRLTHQGYARAIAATHSAFISGLNEILFVAAFILFAAAILAFVLVRRRDFVASGPQVAPEAA